MLSFSRIFEKISFYLTIFFIPFSLKQVLYNPVSGGGLKGLNIISYLFLYPSTIFLLLTLILFFIRLKFKFKDILSKGDIIFLLFLLFSLGVSIFYFSSFSQILKIFRLFLAFLFYLYIKNNISYLKLKNIIIVFIIPNIFEGILSIFEFLNQRDLGLKILGEPKLNIFIAGIAKIKVENLKYLRATGTLPHANILAAFLFFALVGTFYFYSREKNFPIFKKILLSLIAFFLIGGLFFSFSRSGWIIFFIFPFVFLTTYSFLQPKNRKFFKKSISFFVLAILIFLLFAVLFKDFFVYRATFDLKDKAISLRLIYQKMAVKIIEKNPFIGIGFGNYVNYLTKQNAWEKYGLHYKYLFRPVHNIYLLVGAETGIIGLGLFLLFLFATLNKAFKRMRKTFNLYNLIFFSSFICFLIWGISDHFFVDLTQGVYIFWLNLGILSAFNA